MKNLFRNKRRTLLTGSGVTISLFLLTSLAMVYTALGKPFQGIDSSPRLMVRRLSGIVFSMPWSYGARIKAVPVVVGRLCLQTSGCGWERSPFASHCRSWSRCSGQAGRPTGRLEQTSLRPCGMWDKVKAAAAARRAGSIRWSAVSKH